MNYKSICSLSVLEKLKNKRYIKPKHIKQQNKNDAIKEIIR